MSRGSSRVSSVLPLALNGAADDCKSDFLFVLWPHADTNRRTTAVEPSLQGRSNPKLTSAAWLHMYSDATTHQVRARR
ncbi:hypothetical protein HDV57DRAFT_492680 [Trichoderma longibrachiatum]|uniref:Uncharacterized protein n=1 Tax=Trichoderma longibrachiatum ATCC 18648 TaxID=983965 RepID=A0A2T4BPX0_TRILO|nr:hypothetical protein M440DRAFT_217121 [Trichoderma longibrachiatum ATCC 18648]